MVAIPLKISLKSMLHKNVPVKLKEEPHFQALLDHIKKKDIQTKEHLIGHLQQEIALIEKWLEENKRSGSTSVKTVRDNIIHLDVLKKCFSLSQEFLL